MRSSVCTHPLSFLQPSLRVRVIKTEQDGVVGSFTDQEYVFTYAVRGRYLFRMCNREYVITPGCALLIPPHTPHTLIRLSERMFHYVVLFVFEPYRLIKPELSLATIIDRKQRNATLDCLRLMHAEWTGQESGAEYLLSGLLGQLLVYYMRSSRAPQPYVAIHAKATRNIEAALAYMNRNLTSPLDLGQMSRQAGLSPAYFSRCFKQYTGHPPHEYFMRMRVEAAKNHFYHPEYNITQIARLSGFPNVYSFSKVFKRITGASPAQWAKENLNRLPPTVRPSDSA